MGEIDSHAVIRSLRRPGDEVQLTRTIEKLAQTDQVFARGLLTLLIEQAPHRDKASRWFDAESTTEATAERPMRIPGANPRRIDLVLETSRLKLFIEVKLHSDYEPEQLRDYLRAIKPDQGEFLVALTRDVSRFREPDEHAPGWLGVIRWPHLAGPLRDLPDVGPLRQHWQLLLDVLEEDRDLGSSTFPQELLIAYQQSEEAYVRLTEFLEHIGGGVLQQLRAELTDGDASDRSAAMFASRRKRSAAKPKRGRADRDEDYPTVISENEDLYLAFNVPASGPETLWTGFYVDDGHARFYIAAGWGDDVDPPPAWQTGWDAGIERLQHYMHGRDFHVEADGFYCQLDYRLADFIDADDVPAALAASIEQDLPRFVSSGLFSA